MSNIPYKPSLVQNVSAWLAPSIAIAGILFAWIQIHINKKRLKLELFNRRIEIFESITGHMATIIQHGEPIQGSAGNFLRTTKHSYFIFGDDIKVYVNEIYMKTIELDKLCAVLKSLNDKEERSKNLDRQTEIKEWFEEELKNIEIKFKKYIKL